MYLLVMLVVLAGPVSAPAPLALASPTPVAAPAAAAPSPGPTIKPVQWQGVTLGEDIDAVRARLGKPDFNRKVILGSMLVEYPIHAGEGSLVLETSDHQVTQIRVEAAAPKELSLPIGDPFGVNLGDSLTRLLVVRGNPTRSEESDPEESTTTYGGGAENRWVYTLRNGTIVAITLVAPKPPRPVGPSRTNFVLRGTPPPSRPRHVVIKGTPAPSATAIAAGPATPAAPPPPTPLPGIALTTPGPVIAVPTPSPARVSSSAPPTAQPSGAPSPGATPQPADGSSLQTAILVRAADQATGFDYIYRFIENISCGDGTGQFRVVGQDLMSANRRNYAKVTAECSTTHERRAFFFDITYLFARSDR